MQKKQMWFSILVIGLGLSLLSCSSSFAPDSVGGKKFQIVITSGSGEMTNTGKATIKFEKDGSYVITGDNVNTMGDFGKYTYKKIGMNSGAITLSSKVIPEYQESNTFEFVDKKSGKYTAKTETGDLGNQAGNFSEI